MLSQRRASLTREVFTKRKIYTSMNEQRISSALSSIKIRQVPAPLIIGERLNTQGSRIAKRLVMENDYEGLLSLAREQVDNGAHCLDVCVATTERDDEKEFMCNLVKHLCLTVDAPLVIDSTDPEVIEASLEQIPALPIINSINLEGDGSRFRQIAPLMAKYGAPAIAMCIGPDGMAKTPKEKLQVAQMMVKEGEKYGLGKQQFVFDVLTFTLATGEEEFRSAGKNTLDGIRMVHENMPESYTVLGLSNISFGLEKQARIVINSVFLHHAVKAGLDCAIVNAKEIIPYGEIESAEIRLTEDLIFDKSEDALANLISYFDGVKPATMGKKQDRMDESWSWGKKCNYRIMHRLKDGIEKDVVFSISEKLPKGVLISDANEVEKHKAALGTLNEDLLPAMKEVGDKFGAGELILPFVLKSAECMKAAVRELEKYLMQKEGTSKGIFVLGTVQGDVHDIGKNLVKTIFENNGYTVHDLGKQVPLQKFLEKIKETNPDAIGLSALLVATSKQMGLFVEHARKAGMNLPVLCGGAAVNSSFVNRIAKKDSVYNPGVFYCNTMFEGLKIMDKLVSDEREEFVLKWRGKMDKWTENVQVKTPSVQRSDIKPVNPPKIPKTGRATNLDKNDIPLDKVWEMMDEKSLFKLSWGIRGNAAKKTDIDTDELLLQWKERVKRDNLFEPHIVYGYYKCKGMGTKLEVKKWDGGTVTFDFPRSGHERRLCIPDYFGNDDTVAFQAVTVGKKVADLVEKWNKEDQYTDAYYLHGLAVETAEALAEWTHNKIRAELGIGDSGLRYSWGFPSCPDVGQHRHVWDLLQPAKEIMEITKEGQIIPEQSTAAIVVHHPKAAYFTI